MKTGTPIRYITKGALGTIRHPEATRFEERVVNDGDEGVYVGPHPNPRLAEEDWHLTKLTDDDLLVPVHSGLFAAI
jgi:hypothetical protein